MKALEQWVGFGAKPVGVMLATADPHLRMVVAQEFAADRRVALVAQPGTVAEARWRISQSGFEVLLLDAQLDQTLELVGRHALELKAEVVVICEADDEDAAVQAFNAGASGCLARNAWFGRFSQAVLEVANGGAVLPPSLARRLLRQHDLRAPALPLRGAAPAAPGPLLRRLSGRETEVLSMVARGMRTREIGQQLTISGETVNTHIKSIYHKLQVRSRAQAVGLAMHAGLL